MTPYHISYAANIAVGIFQAVGFLSGLWLAAWCVMALPSIVVLGFAADTHTFPRWLKITFCVVGMLLGTYLIWSMVYMVPYYFGISW